MRLSNFLVGCMSATLLGGAAMAQPVLTANMTSDNFFTAYISQDANTQGVAFLSGGNWQDTYTGTFSFDAPGTYYLHVVAGDQGGPRMMVGSFTLSSTGAAFTNGTQDLVTNTTDWQSNTLGWGSAFNTPVDEGGNLGSGTWGTRPGISTSARFIWDDLASPTSYFTTTIRVVPAPGAGLAMIGGLVIAGRRRR